ncbi:MAG TPA: PPOX class F420-dependent oxidoreductase [Bacillota bacterium]|nr:PPOX class F420-dependent oxidoreductase [Bacillota bacterium]
MPLSAKARAMLEAPNIGHLATLMRDGSPQVSPVWVDTDGSHVLVNTAAGRIKWRNIRRDPRVAIDVTERDNPYQMLTIRGRVVEVRSEGAVSHIDKLAKKYTGRDSYGVQPDEERVVLVIEPQTVSGE